MSTRKRSKFVPSSPGTASSRIWLRQRHAFRDYQVAGKYLAGLRRHFGKDARFVGGHEAGCLESSSVPGAVRQVRGRVPCHGSFDHEPEPGSRIKTDRRDAEKIAKCLSSNAYKEVRMLDREDESVRDYIRMRDDFKQVQKELQAKILAMLLRCGVRCDTCKVPWTKKFMAWLGSADMGGALAREAMDEYVSGLERVNEKLEKLDRRILELSGAPRYRDNVRKLVCLPGIKEHTALALCCEVGDFSRFKSPKDLAAFLGLVPGALQRRQNAPHRPDQGRQQPPEEAAYGGGAGRAQEQAVVQVEGAEGKAGRRSRGCGGLR